MTKVQTDRVRAIMDRSGTTATALAWKMGVSPKLLDEILQDGKTSYYYAAKLADALAVPIVRITRA